MIAIKTLEKAIEHHKAEIKKLDNIEPEMNCDLMFVDEQKAEREGYIKDLQKAIDILNKTAIVIKG